MTYESNSPAGAWRGGGGGGHLSEPSRDLLVFPVGLWGCSGTSSSSTALRFRKLRFLSAMITNKTDQLRVSL